MFVAALRRALRHRGLTGAPPHRKDHQLTRQVPGFGSSAKRWTVQRDVILHTDPAIAGTATKGAPPMADMYQFTIATVAEQSADFRRVLWTGRHTQLVIMTIPPGGEIGEETHPDTDQILTFVSGTGDSDVAGQTSRVTQGDLVVVPAGTKHNFRNTGVNPLVLYTVYGPPEHADGTVHPTKEEADAAEKTGQDQPAVG
jgi:mannose-6-phosphate isomerase-like protein (cupin superfamily)